MAVNLLEKILLYWTIGNNNNKVSFIKCKISNTVSKKLKTLIRKENFPVCTVIYQYLMRENRGDWT